MEAFFWKNKSKLKYGSHIEFSENTVSADPEEQAVKKVSKVHFIYFTYDGVNNSNIPP